VNLSSKSHKPHHLNPASRTNFIISTPWRCVVVSHTQTLFVKYHTLCAVLQCVAAQCTVHLSYPSSRDRVRLSLHTHKLYHLIITQLYICAAHYILFIECTHGGDRTSNNYECQNLKQVFTKFKTSFHGSPRTNQPLFTGVPKIIDKFSRETESPSHQRSTRESGASGDTDI